MRSARVATMVAFGLACVWAPAASARSNGYGADVTVLPVRALLQRGHLSVEVSTPGRQRVVLTVTAVDPVLYANSDYVVPVYGPRTVLVDHRRTLRIPENAAMRAELGSAPRRMSVTVTLGRERQVLARRTRGFLRQRIPGAFVPPAGAEFAGLTSQGEPISFTAGPVDKAVRSFRVVIRADPNMCDLSFAPVPKLWADGYFNDFIGGEGYQYLDGFFRADGSASGELDNSTQVDACDYRITFTVHRVGP